MTINDGWAKAAIRLIGAKLDATAVPPGLAPVAAFGTAQNVIVFPVADDAELPLQELLGRLELFVGEHSEDLRLLRRNDHARLEVFLGWSPAGPQDSVTLAPSLLSLLAEQEFGIVIDTYSD
jgi:hypothetical protein